MTNASTTSTATTTGTTGQFTSANWVETVIAPAEPTTVPRLARAAVTNDFAGGITAAGSCEYTLVYATEKTGGFNGLELLTGTLDGRPGSFVLDHRGSFTEDGTIHCEFEVVPGSGTGALAELRGSGSFRARPGESVVPYVFSYDLGQEIGRGGPA
ncbi:DUF3224 domain-containing protein [Kitasatospora sp. GAS1066B]|uniref:DUF3224 domain-containing protein n=1 Tax=Kitasatospora sp. GAS1066B TaxID=3156271 RepID=UPI0035122587